jgi:hypothetical protein
VLVHSARLEHEGGGLAACSIEMVASHWVEVLAIEASTSGSSGIVLESLVTISGIEDMTLALASAADSSVVV